MFRLTLHNRFHNTEVNVMVPDDLAHLTESEAYDWLDRRASDDEPGARARLRRVYKALCGMDDCRCGVVR